MWQTSAAPLSRERPLEGDAAKGYPRRLSLGKSRIRSEQLWLSCETGQTNGPTKRAGSHTPRRTNRGRAASRRCSRFQVSLTTRLTLQLRYVRAYGPPGL